MPALAAAVTPIMKLEVAEETLIGSRSAESITGTLSTPLPMPSRADTRPAAYSRPSFLSSSFLSYYTIKVPPGAIF
jgi:hypothetical protein